MMYVAFDTETHPFRPGLMAPPLVCAQFCEEKGDPFLFGGDEEGKQSLFRVLRAYIEDPGIVIVGKNLAYDVAVTIAQWPELEPLWFQKYDEGLVRCVEVREFLLDIADGCLLKPRKGQSYYGLEFIAKRYNVRQSMDKDEDGWRLRYNELDGTPPELWPDRALNYALEDARVTMECYLEQEARAERMDYALDDQCEQFAASLSLHLASCWGLRADPQRTAEYLAAADRDIVRATRTLERLGLASVKRGRDDQIQKVTKKIKALRELVESICEQRNVSAPRTNPSKRHPYGQVKTDADTIEDFLRPRHRVPWRTYSKAEKRKSTFGETLLKAVKAPLHPRFRSPIESGRASASPAGVHNPPRKGGFRECYTPRIGWVYVYADYSGQEMRTHAQCLAWIVGPENSLLVQRFQADRYFDPHTFMAAYAFANISYEEGLTLLKDKDAPGHKEFKKHRQNAKVPNFGLPGGMGAGGLRAYAKATFGLEWSLDYCEWIIEKWHETWPEMSEYFAFVRRCSEEGEVRQFVSKRLRGGLSYCDLANTFFQGLAADVTKAAFWEATKRSRLDTASALYGSRAVNCIHDEPMFESPIATAPDAADELAKLMVEVMERYTPDVPAAADPAVATVWSKDAVDFMARGDDGRLLIWDPVGMLG